MILYPAIDLYEGRCVRLYKGDYSKMKVVDLNPLDRAKYFEDFGFTHLHLVDLKSAQGNVAPDFKLLDKLVSSTRLKIDFSGGLRNLAYITRALESGADAVTIGSLGVLNPEIVRQILVKHGGDKVILALDSREGVIAINGWKERTQIDIQTVLSWYLDYGLQRVMSTDISRDGTGAGIQSRYYRKLMDDYSQLEWIVSGGVAGVEDVQLAEKLGANGLVIGKALYSGSLTFDELKPWLK